MPVFKLLMTLFIISSALISCNKDSGNIDSNSQNVELRKCKNCVTALLADVGGGMSGVSTGAWWGGLLGPTGAVVGGMLGGVIGSVAGSVGAGRAAGDFPTYLNVPLAPVNDNSTNNPFDNFGILHNQLLNKYLKSNLTGSNLYNDLFLDAKIYIENNSNYSLTAFAEENFKSNFHNEFSSCYNRSFANTAYYNQISQQMNSISNSNDLENYIREELKKNLSNEQLFGLAILRHSYYYWNI